MTDALAVNLEAPCWLWMRGKKSGGYGALYVEGQMMLAHRYMWSMMRGEIPADKQIHHLCKVPACVNPQHLKLVTHRQHMRYGPNATKTACKRGHLFTEANTYRHGGQRHCRACRALLARERRRSDH